MSAAQQLRITRRAALGAAAALAAGAGAVAAAVALPGGSRSSGARSSGAGPPGAGVAAGSCLPPGSHQLASDAVVRVYSVTGARSPRLAAPAVYACYLPRGRRVSLTGASSFTRVGAVALAGPVVAYGEQLMGVDTSSSAVRVLDLASGASRTLAAASSTPTRPESFTSVAAVVVDRGGAVAWIAVRSGVGQPRATYEVRRANRSGDVLLDSGAAIAPGSLRLRSGRVTWRDGGRTRSASLR